MRQCHWLGSALCLSFSALTLGRWQAHSTHKNLCHSSPTVLFQNGLRKKTDGELVNPSSSGKLPLKLRYLNVSEERVYVMITGRMKFCSTLKRRLVNRSITSACSSYYRPVLVHSTAKDALYHIWIIPSTRNIYFVCILCVAWVDQDRSFLLPLYFHSTFIPGATISRIWFQAVCCAMSSNIFFVLCCLSFYWCMSTFVALGLVSSATGWEQHLGYLFMSNDT